MAMNGDRILRIGAIVGAASFAGLLATIVPMYFMEPQVRYAYYKSQTIYVLQGIFGWGWIIGSIMAIVLLKRWIEGKIRGRNTPQDAPKQR